MEVKNCTNCGKELHDGEWVSKSGLCRSCAEAKHDQQDQKNKKKYLIIAIASILFVALTLTIAITQAPNYPESILDAEGNLTTEAQIRFTIIAHNAVEDNLKAPKTAEFEAADEKWYMFEDGVYGVSGTVTAENSFGVPLTGGYFVKFKIWGLDYDENEVLEVEIE